MVVPAGATIEQAYAFCEKLARDHYENFPVASVLLPRRMRPPIAAIYAFARTADDFADEPGRDPAERLRLLDDFRAQLHAAVRDIVQRGDATDHAEGPSPPATAPGSAAADETSPLFVALRHTIEHHQLPVQLFEDLLSAFRQDVVVHRYETWDDVQDYCRRSANPVGRLVLRVAGIVDDDADAASDAVCTALQLANFWQDLGTDWRNGRLYVPAEEARRHGAKERDLDGPAMTPQWAAAVGGCVERTRRLFERGRPVTAVVGGRLRLELRATWLGGVRILDKIEALGCDTLHRRPKLGATDAARIAAGVLLWRT